MPGPPEAKEAGGKKMAPFYNGELVISGEIKTPGRNDALRDVAYKSDFNFDGFLRDVERHQHWDQINPVIIQQYKHNTKNLIKGGFKNGFT